METPKLTDLLEAIGRLENRMFHQTQNAESHCWNVILHLQSDGSGRLIFKWSQKANVPVGTSQTERGLMNFLATVASDDDCLETSEDFDNLNELSDYLKCQKVM